MLGYSPLESSLASIICMVGAILFVRRIGMTKGLQLECGKTEFCYSPMIVIPFLLK